mmetsp:Transcript_23061/g.72475  ORF Transcript_23061/g.72475 Transcript_23061/m.72475 type:complete len:293 (-) Transcript_23061:1054-1932(-)
MAVTTPGGASGAVGALAAGWLKLRLSRARCSSSTCAATSAAPPEHSSAASAMASEMPSESRSAAALPVPRCPRPAERDPAVGGLAPEGCEGRGRRPPACPAPPRPAPPRDAEPALPVRPPAALELSPVELLLLAASTAIEVEPSACLRARAGRRHVGQVVASRIVFAQLSRHDAWKMCEHLGMGRTLSPDLISSWQTVQIRSSGGISSCGDDSPLTVDAPGVGGGDAPGSVCGSSARPMPAPSASGAFEARLAAASACPSRTRARRTPQSHCRRELCEFSGGTPRRLMSASW